MKKLSAQSMVFYELFGFQRPFNCGLQKSWSAKKSYHEVMVVNQRLTVIISVLISI